MPCLLELWAFAISSRRKIIEMKRKPKPLNILPKQKRQPQGKAKRRFTKNPDDYPCPVCGETKFEWGHLIGGIYAKNTILGIPLGGRKALHARICQTCGNVLTFLED
jgi:hypothetical protein